MKSKTIDFKKDSIIGKYVGTDGLVAITLIMPVIMLLAGIDTILYIDKFSSMLGAKGNTLEYIAIYSKTVSIFQLIYI